MNSIIDHSLSDIHSLRCISSKRGRFCCDGRREKSSRVLEFCLDFPWLEGCIVHL